MQKKQLWYAGVSSAVLMCAFLLYCFLPIWTAAEPRAQTTLLSASGSVLYRFGDGLPEEILTEQSISTLPAHLMEALIASEDQHFYQHHGIDFLALMGGGGRGASTITSQSIKRRYFAQEPRTLLQKAREFTLAIFWETSTTKEAILADYLSLAPFGRNYVGIHAAARGYFGKSPEMLSLHEAAWLVGLLPAPERYSKDPERALERQKLVLDRMVEEKYITSQEAGDAQQLALALVPDTHTIRAPHAVYAALAEAKDVFPEVESGGYTISTTINVAWHDAMTDIIQRDLKGLEGKNVGNGAAVVIEPDTGAIRVLIGSKDYFAEGGQFNVADALRQPGSSLKPFTYLAAFLEGYSPGSILYDIESSFATDTKDPYIPRNYDLKFHGPVSMRESLGSSLNIPAVKTLELVGFDRWYDLLAQFGITFAESPEHYGLGITLGGGEVTLRNLTHAYSMLANNGKKTQAHLVEKITKGETTYYQASRSTTPLLPEKQAQLEAALMMVNDVLRDNTAREISFGLTSRLRITDAVAVKTGTTKDYRDNWAHGYTPRIAVGVWVGNNDNTPMQGVTGITGAIPILHDFLRLRTTETEAMQPWPVSPLVTTARICRLSGMLATTLCPQQREELYLQGTAPIEEDTWYREVTLDSRSGLLADATCTEATYTKTFLFVPTALRRWAASILLEEAPTLTCSGEETLPAATEWTISHPKNQDTFTLKNDIPQEAQRLPVHVDGFGYLRDTISLDGQPISVEGALPLTTFIDLTPGEHKLVYKNTTIHFTVLSP